MKRFHVHVRVKNLDESIEFYNALFDTQPTVQKADYAKWMLEDPRINYAISTGHSENGIEHLGLQLESETELHEVFANMQKAKGTVREEGECTCCYSKSQKSWITDPQGVDWEAFYTHGTATVYGEGTNAKPAPEVMEQWTGNDGKNAVLDKTMMVILILFFQIINFGFAQSSQVLSREFKSISPTEDHYERLAKLPTSGDNVALDSLRFPIEDFRRSAYLKLRTVYLDVPTSFFKIQPFPANSSNQTKAEIAFLIDLQAKRSAELMAKTDEMANIYYDPFTNNPANEDYERNIRSLFHIGKDLGNWYTPDKLPETARVLQNVIQDATYYFFNLKADFARPRPYHLSKDIKNPEAPGHSAYPSGHSSASYVNAYLLAEIFPELNDKFLSNAYDMAFSREIRGVHYPSDSRAGKVFAFQFVQQILKEKSFKSDFEKIKSELKAASIQNGN
jgi:acid phosphatase (class A)